MKRKDGLVRRKELSLHTPETLKSCTEPDSVSGCWNWILSLNMHGYGQTTQNKKHIGSHRLMFALTHPEIDIVGKFICHHCDNRKCINPAHLYAGTAQSNMDDRSARNRVGYTGHPGELHYAAKLNEEKVREIRARHATGNIGYRNLGKEYGVDRTIIRGIIKGKYWGRVS